MPRSSVTPLNVLPVAAFTAVMVTPGRTAPVESVTVPGDRQHHEQCADDEEPPHEFHSNPPEDSRLEQQGAPLWTLLSRTATPTPLRSCHLEQLYEISSENGFLVGIIQPAGVQNQVDGEPASSHGDLL
jgi:hypothetical protein